MYRLRFLILFLTFVGLIYSIPAVSAQDIGTSVTITTRDNLNVRAEPSVNGMLIGTLPANTTVEILSRFQNESSELWLLIPFNSSEAWIAGWLVDIEGDLESVPWARLAPGKEPVTLENVDQLAVIASFPRQDIFNQLQFEWLPDGRLLVGRNGAIDVYTPDGQLLDTWAMPYDFVTFTVHPSGQWLLYLRQSFMPSGVFSYDITTGKHHYWDQIRLKGWNLAYAAGHAWSEDGSRLLLFNNWSRMTDNPYGYQTTVIDVATQSAVGQLDLECSEFVDSNHVIRCQSSAAWAYRLFDLESDVKGETLAASQLSTASGIAFTQVGLPTFSKDGSLIFYRGQDSNYTSYLVVADATTLQPLKKYVGHIFAEAINSDGSLAVIREYTNDIQYYVIEPVTGNFQFDLPDYSSVVGEFSPDDAYLAVHFSDPARPILRVYDTASGQMLWEIAASEDAALTAAFSQDGQYLLQGLVNGRLVYTNITTGQSRSVWQKQNISNIFDAVYLPDALGQYITLMENDQNYVTLYDARSMAEAQRISLGENYYSSGTQYSRDGNFAVKYIGDGAALLDLQQGKTLEKLIDHDLDRLSYSCFASFDLAQPPFLPIFPNKAIVALPNKCDKGIVLWFYAENDNITLPTDYEPLALYFLSDGRLLALGNDSAVHVYDVDSQEEISTHPTPYLPVMVLDDNLIILETPELQYVFWNMETEQIIGQPLDGRPYLLSPDSYLLLGVNHEQLVVYGITEETN